MKVSEREFSALVSPFDIRDYRVAVTTTEFPTTFELPAVSVKNQGSTGSCVAYACSSVVEYHNKKQENTNTIFSTEFIYGYRPEGYYVGEGMYIRDALKTLQKVGDCPLFNLRGNHKCPKAMEIVNTKFNDLKDLAYPHRISSYAKVSSINEIKQALVDFGYVIVSMPWHKNYKLKNGVYTYSSDESTGYHCVCIYGWNEHGWLVHNSWGSGWGKKGKFIVPFEFKWREAWAVVDHIVNDEQLIKPKQNWFIKFFAPIINIIATFFVKLIKKDK